MITKIKILVERVGSNAWIVSARDAFGVIASVPASADKDDAIRQAKDAAKEVVDGKLSFDVQELSK